MGWYIVGLVVALGLGIELGVKLERRVIAAILKSRDYLKVSMDGCQKRASQVVSILEERMAHYL